MLGFPMLVSPRTCLAVALVAVGCGMDSGDGEDTAGSAASATGEPCLTRPSVGRKICAWGPPGSCLIQFRLPAPDVAAPGTPTRCEELPFELELGDSDGDRCVVSLRDQDTDNRPGEGCAPLRTLMLPEAPAPDVHVLLDCGGVAQTLPLSGLDISLSVEQPAIGDPCLDVPVRGQILNGDPACHVVLSDGRSDERMFCHPSTGTCVRQCSVDLDCPAGWVCDSTEASLPGAGPPSCVHPACM